MSIFVDVLGGVTEDAGFKPPCRVATTADLGTALTGLPIIDGVQIEGTDRILVWNQSNPVTNGIYNANNGGAWTRAIDFSSSSAILAGTQVFVSSGNTYAQKRFECLVANPVVGTTAIYFSVVSDTPIGGTTVVFPTQAMFAAASGVPSTVTLAIVGGFASVGDSPVAAYMKVGSNPGLIAGQFQRPDGTWWRIFGGRLYPEQISAVGATDDSTALINANSVAAALGMELVIDQIHTITNNVTFSVSVKFIASGRIKVSAAHQLTFQSGFSAQSGQYIFDFSTLHTLSGGYQGVPGASASGFSIARMPNVELTPYMFGAKGDNSTLDDIALDACFLAMFATSCPINLCSGQYLCHEVKNYDVTLLATSGFSIYGDGETLAAINFPTITSGVPFWLLMDWPHQTVTGTTNGTTTLIVSSGSTIATGHMVVSSSGDLPLNCTVTNVSGTNVTISPGATGSHANQTISFGPPVGWFRPKLYGFSINGSLNAPLVKIGRDDLTDQPNIIHLEEFGAYNPVASGTNSEALRINSAYGGVVINCNFNCYANGLGANYGYALRLRQCQFLNFTGGSFGNAGYGVAFTDGVSLSCGFYNVDVENVSFCFSNQSSSSGKHIIDGCQLSLWTSAALSAPAQIGNTTTFRARECNFQPGSGGPYNSNQIDPTNYSQIVVEDAQTISTPSLAGNGVAVANKTGKAVFIQLAGGSSLNALVIEGITLSSLTSGASVTGVLRPGASVTPSYGSGATWSWTPVR